MSASTDQATYNSPITGAAGAPSKLYEMSSFANQNRLSASLGATSQTDDESTAASSRAALLQYQSSDDFDLAQKLQDEYHDEDRSMEFAEREKEEMREREREEARRRFEGTMWWVKRATVGVAVYAVGSVLVLRVLPMWFGSEEGGE